ncbi:MAG: type I-G CRISPR-associated protein Csb2, partial [Streptosporangiaceae bacterium]
MATTIALRFPLGLYHATPWDRSVNEGAIEWPPSPWRLLRALVATWYTRWPDLPPAAIDGLLETLGDPPCYSTPPTWPAHTRHYLPDLRHRKGAPGGTDLTLDPFLRIEPDAAVLVRWDADLDEEQRSVLAKLVELLPYLGRAESVCEARLLDQDPEPDETWWRPGTEGKQRARLLAAARPIARSQLELSTVDVRKSRRTVPPGTTWVSYAIEPSPWRRALPRHRAHEVTAIRFFVTGPALLRAANGILLADEVHRQVGHRLARAGVTDARRQAVMGSNGAATHHRHVHWIPVADGTQPSGPVSSLVIWAPGGLATDEVAAVMRVHDASGKRGGEEGYEIRGFPPVELLFQAAGTIEQVAPELCGPARRWRSRTPYLPVRHRKREQLDDFVAADVAAELGYRDLPAAKVTGADQFDGLPDRWARAYRRYRMNEHLGKSRPGLG